MSAVRTPATREELAELLRAASAEGTPVGIRGGGSASRRGPVTDPPARAISTAGLARILSHEPADLTVTVEAGCPLGELQAALAARGQTWMQAGARPGATVGGVLTGGCGTAPCATRCCRWCWPPATGASSPRAARP